MFNLLDMALHEVQFLKLNEKFLVKDLFKGYEWNRLPLNDRRLLGRLFINEESNEYLKAGIIKALPDKNDKGQQVYVVADDVTKIPLTEK